VRRTDGFTLIEVLVALIVVGIGALALAAIFPAATGDIGVAQRRTRAAEYLQEGVERLTSLSYDDPLLTPWVRHEDRGNPLPGGYERRWTVTPDYPIAGCKRITVEVIWKEGDDTRLLRAATCVASVGR